MATPGICVGRAPLAVHISSISVTGVYILSIGTTARTTKYKAPTVPVAIARLRVNVDMIIKYRTSKGRLRSARTEGQAVERRRAS